MVTLKYLKKHKIFIPKLKSKGRELSLPLKDFVKGGFLPADQQLINVSENEASDLIRVWKDNFEIIKEKKIKKDMEVKANDN